MLSKSPILFIVHDLAFAGSGNRSSVNEDTDFHCAPLCEVGLCASRVLSAGAVSQANARQVPVDPEDVPVLGCKVGNQVVVDLRLQFCWRGSIVY